MYKKQLGFAYKEPPKHGKKIPYGNGFPSGFPKKIFSKTRIMRG